MVTKAQVKWGGRSWHLVPCDGSAHSPEVGGMQDRCGICTPFWARVCVPVGCETPDQFRMMLVPGALGERMLRHRRTASNKLAKIEAAEERAADLAEDEERRTRRMLAKTSEGRGL